MQWLTMNALTGQANNFKEVYITTGQINYVFT